MKNSILSEAHDLINGDRAEAYGSPLVMGTKIAAMWSAILEVNITPEQVQLCMIALKICRQLNKDNRDNLVDIAGYAGVIEKIANEKGVEDVGDGW